MTMYCVTFRRCCNIADPKLGASDFEASYRDSTGRSLKEYRLPKDLTVTLITGYRADLRYKVVKRLEQLEARTPQLPDFSNPAAAARAWADAVEQSERIKSELMPKAEAFQRLEERDGSLNLRLSSKTLGFPERKLARFMQMNEWAFRHSSGGPFQAYAAQIKQGYLEHKPTRYIGRDGEKRHGTQLMITAKGLARLAYLLRDEPKISNK